MWKPRGSGDVWFTPLCFPGFPPGAHDALTSRSRAFTYFPPGTFLQFLTCQSAVRSLFPFDRGTAPRGAARLSKLGRAGLRRREAELTARPTVRGLCFRASPAQGGRCVCSAGGRRSPPTIKKVGLTRRPLSLGWIRPGVNGAPSVVAAGSRDRRGRQHREQPELMLPESSLPSEPVIQQSHVREPVLQNSR